MKHLSILPIALSTFISLWLLAGIAMPFAHANVNAGLDILQDNVAIPTGSDNARETLGDTSRFVITYVALAATITIIAAGFYLILGFGTDHSRDAAKKIMIYTLIGVIVIFFARVIVGFFTEELPREF